MAPKLVEIALITLINDYHNTRVTLMAKDYCLSPGQVRNAKAVLCGSEACTCGGEAGERGVQRYQLIPAGAGGAFVRDTQKEGA